MKTLSGSLLGYGDDTVVVVGDDGTEEKKFRLRDKSRFYYCKKCIKKEMDGGIALAHKSRMDHPCMLVLAVGDGCGKKHQLTKVEKEMGMSKQASFRLEPMTKIFTPDDHPFFIKPSPYSEGEILERFVHEDAIKGIIE